MKSKRGENLLQAKKSWSICRPRRPTTSRPLSLSVSISSDMFSHGISPAQSILSTSSSEDFGVQMSTCDPGEPSGTTLANSHLKCAQAAEFDCESSDDTVLDSGKESDIVASYSDIYQCGRLCYKIHCQGSSSVKSICTQCHGGLEFATDALIHKTSAFFEGIFT